MSSQLERLREVMAALRANCPWDAEQTHHSLVPYLIEETGEVVDAIETGTDDDLREELGDLLLQVYFHAQIAENQGRFDLEDIAQGIADKLVRRHPHVFSDAEVPQDVRASWEAAKRAEKGRSSSLEGIASSLATLSRSQKVLSRASSHQIDLGLASDEISFTEVGEAIVGLVARAQASGVDADQATRAALRACEQQIRTSEGN